MTTELTNLALVTTLTGLLWIPYILNRLAVGPGLLHEIGYPDEERLRACSGVVPVQSLKARKKELGSS